VTVELFQVTEVFTVCLLFLIYGPEDIKPQHTRTVREVKSAWMIVFWEFRLHLLLLSNLLHRLFYFAFSKPM